MSQQSESQGILETTKQTSQQFLLRYSSKSVQSGADRGQMPMVRTMFIILSPCIGCAQINL